jgi:hypothetical protein
MVGGVGTKVEHDHTLKSNATTSMWGSSKTEGVDVVWYPE